MTFKKISISHISMYIAKPCQYKIDMVHNLMPHVKIISYVFFYHHIFSKTLLKIFNFINVASVYWVSYYNGVLAYSLFGLTKAYYRTFNASEFEKVLQFLTIRPNAMFVVRITCFKCSNPCWFGDSCPLRNGYIPL